MREVAVGAGNGEAYGTPVGSGKLGKVVLSWRRLEVPLRPVAACVKVNVLHLILTVDVAVEETPPKGLPRGGRRVDVAGDGPCVGAADVGRGRDVVRRAAERHLPGLGHGAGAGLLDCVGERSPPSFRRKDVGGWNVHDPGEDVADAKGKLVLLDRDRSVLWVGAVRPEVLGRLVQRTAGRKSGDEKLEGHVVGLVRRQLAHGRHTGRYRTGDVPGHRIAGVQHGEDVVDVALGTMPQQRQAQQAGACGLRHWSSHWA
mmetsp:Transcript_81369/g.242525  ORF Transcript_81369/g.242525 Transcript_81369/m.242525 type:complete len:258 (-) Transcript_81369:68-841(-)